MPRLPGVGGGAGRSDRHPDPQVVALLRAWTCTHGDALPTPAVTLSGAQPEGLTPPPSCHPCVTWVPLAHTVWLLQTGLVGSALPCLLAHLLLMVSGSATGVQPSLYTPQTALTTPGSQTSDITPMPSTFPHPSPGPLTPPLKQAQCTCRGDSDSIGTPGGPSTRATTGPSSSHPKVPRPVLFWGVASISKMSFSGPGQANPPLDTQPDSGWAPAGREGHVARVQGMSWGPT